ncbi:hypothetical protein DINM_003385 [Dirofilaria immitis]|nr:hypothetical protein [Dirofilaria immitis]
MVRVGEEKYKERCIIYLTPLLSLTTGTSPSIPIAFCGSLSWMEFSLIEYDVVSFILSPLLAILQGLTAIGLSAPAFYSWINSTISADASWESIDYLLIGVSIIFMPNYKYSEMWLQLNLIAYDFMVLEHAKFWAASIGQWFVQNMAHATIFAFSGKIVMFGALARYFSEIKRRQKLMMTAYH